MAVKYAVANGNWADGTTWNGGVVPVDGDEVYLDGYQVTANADINVLCTVTNGMNNITGRSGGIIYSNANDRNITISIIALIGVNDYTIPIFKPHLWRGRTITLNCDITGYVKIISGANLDGTMAYLVVNGNVKGAMLWDGNNIWGSITVNGNVDNSEAQYAFISATGAQNQSHFINVTINVNINTDNNRLSLRRIMKYVVINGNLTTNSSVPLLTPFVTTEDSYCYFNGRLISTNGATLSDNLQKLKVGQLTQMQFPDLNGAPVVLSAYPLVVDYPQESDVKKDVEYAWGEKIGTYLPDYPPETVVLKDYVYDNGDKIGSLENQNIVGCVTPEDVRKDVPLVGMGVVGSLVVPSVDDVREGVVFDNGSVGTLIVQGGGDRLRIADFGYYTRSTSITYIVDLTESDKPAFADCEEIVLRSLFPTLDLDNIPDKFFDDLFVQFLRYRLLVEYYRGTSINSKFTPSEPTAEIVNYANTKCEYWLNTANLFLQLWGEKYPNSVKKDRILL